MHNLNSISPLDGRYAEQIFELSNYFSEMALIKYRLMVEVEYLILLSEEKGVKEIKKLGNLEIKKLRNLYLNFTLSEAEKIKKIEATTKHDVKAVEYYLQNKLRNLKLTVYLPFLHFAITSEDINNLAFSLMWQDGVKNIYLKSLLKITTTLKGVTKKYQDTAMLALTHGQPATPTTVGKEVAVFIARLNRQIKQLQNHKLLGKFGGATGTWAAHQIAYPNIDWLKFSTKFIKSLGLEPNLLTIQIETHDALAENYQNLERINTILIDFCRDTWMYISRGIFAQKNKAGEVGSSTMPHKINPIYFENAEGNLGLANALLNHLAQKLPISRMQRDLTDSTVLRNQGVVLGHSLLANQNILNGLSRLTVNEMQLKKELDGNPEVLAEAIQTILRKCGHTNAYEQLKELTRGHEISLDSIHSFVKKLDIPQTEKQKLLKLTPEKYIGLAGKIVNLC